MGYASSPANPRGDQKKDSWDQASGSVPDHPIPADQHFLAAVIGPVLQGPDLHRGPNFQPPHFVAPSPVNSHCLPDGIIPPKEPTRQPGCTQPAIRVLFRTFEEAGTVESDCGSLAERGARGKLSSGWNAGGLVTTTRRPRLGRDELRALFIEAGRAIVREEGLGTGGEMLTLKRAREWVEADSGIHVTNASIIGRVWESQVEFATDVLVAIAADYSSTEIEDTLRAVAPILTDVDSSSEESRRSALRELCRVGSATQIEALRSSQEFFRWIAVWALTALGAESDNRRRIESALQQSYVLVTEHLDGIYQLILDLLGYRLRPGLTIRQFTISAEALIEGILLRERVNAGHFDGIKRPTGAGGEEQEWTLLGVTVDALAETFFELDPDWTAPLADSTPASNVPTA